MRRSERRIGLWLRDRFGKWQRTGLKPRTTELGKVEIFRRRKKQTVPIWDGTFDACPLIPFAQWVAQPASWDEYLRRHIDQAQTTACAMASGGHIGELRMAANGQKFKPLDWEGAWRSITGGRGGIALDNAIRYAFSPGFPIENDDARRVRYLEAWDIPTLEAAGSAVQQGCSLWIGHDGHAEVLTRLVKRGSSPASSIFRKLNSWASDTWSDVRLDLIDFAYGCFGVRAVEVFKEDVE